MKKLDFLSMAALALTAYGPVAAAPAGDVVAGRATFAAACASCHQVGPSARSGFGPQLNGILGRPIGSAADYGNSYSAAMKMKNSKIVWTEQNLAAFIKNPDRVVPGTKMRFFAIGYNERKIADLLAYLGGFPASD